MLIMQVESNALQWVLVYCIGFGDSSFKASLSIYSIKMYFVSEGKKNVFFLYVLSLKFHSELVAG